MSYHWGFSMPLEIKKHFDTVELCRTILLQMVDEKVVARSNR
jgi:hypothetical protein